MHIGTAPMHGDIRLISLRSLQMARSAKHVVAFGTILGAVFVGFVVGRVHAAGCTGSHLEQISFSTNWNNTEKMFDTTLFYAPASSSCVGFYVAQDTSGGSESCTYDSSCVWREFSIGTPACGTTSGRTKATYIDQSSFSRTISKSHCSTAS